jgi:hypothetical protein
MVLLNKNRQLYYKQKVSGSGMVYKEISENGIFKDSLKTLGKYASFGLKNLWKNALKPKTIMLAKEGVEMGKDLFKENKGNIQKLVSKQSQGILKKLLNRDKVTKQDLIAEGKEVLSNTKTDLINLAKENRDKVSERSKEILDKLLYGEGLKILR